MKFKTKYVGIIVLAGLTLGCFLVSKYIFNPSSLSLPKDTGSIDYKVYWGIVPLGRAQITINDNELYNGKESILIEARAKTTGIMRILFDAWVEIYSVVDKARMTPVMYHEVIFNRGKRESKILYYDQDKNILKTEEGVYRILPNTYDPVSALFFLKHKKIKKGDSFDINVDSNQSNYGVKFDVVDEVQARNQKLFVLKGLSERRQGEKARHRVEFTMYAGGEGNVPVLIKAFTPLGFVTIKIIPGS